VIRFRRWRDADDVLRVIATGLRSTRSDGSTAARIERFEDRFRAVVAIGAEGEPLHVAIGSEAFCASAAELWLVQNAIGAWPHGGVALDGTRDGQAFERAMASVETARAPHAA